MTTMFNCPVRCSVCGQKVEVNRIGSCTTIGRLMSGRPRFMGVSPLGFEFQRCPGCGYVARDLSEPLGLDRSVLESDEYAAMLSECGPAGARGLLLSMKGEHRDAAMAYLHGAWHADDFNRGTAMRLRGLSIDEFLKALPEGPGDRMLMADMLRCTGRFAEAERQVDRILSDPRCEELWEVAAYEGDLIDARDTDAKRPVGKGERPGTEVHRMALDRVALEKVRTDGTACGAVPNDEGHRGISIGDFIAFESGGDGDPMYARVTDVREFNSSEELRGATGCPAWEDVDQGADGVLAIGVELLPMSDSW